MTFRGKEMEGIFCEGCKAMTWEDAEEMIKLNEESGWGFTKDEMIDLIFDHMRAYIFFLKGDDTANNGIREMEMIEYRLRDVSFNEFADMLNKHNYDEAMDGVKYAFSEEE